MKIKNILWTVVTANKFNCVLILSLFKSLGDAINYAAFVTDYDDPNYLGWITYVVEGDFFNVYVLCSL